MVEERELAGTAEKQGTKRGNAGVRQAEKEARRNRQGEKVENQRVVKPWAKVARTKAAKPQGKQEARKDGAPTGSREPATTVANMATAPGGAPKARVEEEAK